MKNIKYLIVSAFLCMLTFSSCEDFLNMQPSNSGNAETAIATPADAQVSINGIMRAMSSSNYYGRNMIMFADGRGGDLAVPTNGYALEHFFSYSISPTSNSYSGFWTTGYYIIMQINSLLENIDRLEGEGVSGFSYYKGQALTLRALLYFDLVRLYGLPYNYKPDSYGVPLTTTPLAANAQLTRATVKENYQQIIADLDAGKTLLASDKKLQNGFIGYYANLALQARVRLYMDDYNGALAAAQEIIADGKYKLYEPSDWVASWTKQYGSESIFELGIDSESDLTTASMGYYLMKKGQKSSAYGNFTSSSYFLARLSEDATDVRWGIMDDDTYAVERGAQYKGSCYKYCGSTDFAGDGKETFTAVNVKIFRLSEIYLIAAEASLHSSSPNKEAAAEYLNAIRKRSPALAAATAATITDDMILDERSKELFAEGHRFFDLIRKNKTVKYDDETFGTPHPKRPGSEVDRTFELILLPIPQSEINANPTLKSQQNPGY